MIIRLTKSVLALVFVGALAACGAADPTEEVLEPGQESSDVAADMGTDESPASEDVVEAESALSACPCGDGWYCSGGNLVRRVTSGGYCTPKQIIYCDFGCVHQACGLNDYCL